MLEISEDTDRHCLVLEAAGALTPRDLDALRERFEAARARTGGREPNLVIRSASFPTWTELSALGKHLGFIRAEHRRVRKVALVSDARALSLAPRLAARLVRAEVRRFPADALEAALDWAGKP